MIFESNSTKINANQPLWLKISDAVSTGVSNSTWVHSVITYQHLIMTTLLNLVINRLIITAILTLAYCSTWPDLQVIVLDIVVVH